MKKLMIFLGLVMVHVISLHANIKIRTIDSAKIMQESREGKGLIAQYEKEKNTAIAKIQDLGKEIVTLEEMLQKQRTLLSKEAFLEKSQELAKKKKIRERKAQEMAEDVNSKFQIKQESLYLKTVEAAKEVFKVEDKDGDGILFDVRAPGVIAVGKKTALDSSVRKVVDTNYAKANQVKAIKRREIKRA